MAPNRHFNVDVASIQTGYQINGRQGLAVN